MVNLDEPLKLEQRTTLGKGLGNLRREGLVPAVIHNHGQASIHVMAPETELDKVYQAAGKHHPLNLRVGSDSYLALIKDVDINPVKRRMQHVVFQAIRQDEKVEAEIPLHWEGDFAAEKIGLEVQRQLDTVEVEALPKDLPDQIVVDATKLAELGDKITVADLVVPAGVTVTTDPDHPIATVVEPKEQIVEEETPEVIEGEEGAAAEGETAEAGEGDTTTQESAKE
jgi:large subunit ribosomal protein L25